jgi:hypothetical protein
MMNRIHWLAATGALAVLVTAVGSAQAGRVPSTRTSGFKSTGARQDISVPYLTTGRSAFGAYRVAPKIYSSPTVNDPQHPQAKPVFNLIFYGSQQSFGGKSNGATPKAR